MKILVINKVIETTEIVGINDVEQDKRFFLNREAGFKILMLDGTVHIFKEDIPYESYLSDISSKKAKWNALMQKVIQQWEADKVPIPSFQLNQP